jgi:hypothetical protein
MHQKTVVFYLRRKGMTLDAIHDDLMRILGEEAVACSSVTKYTQSAQPVPTKEVTPSEAADIGYSLIEEAILTALGEFPFSCVRQLSRGNWRFRSPTHRHMTQLLRFMIRRLQ